MENTSNADRILKILRSIIERSDKSGTKRYFSVFIILDEEDKKEIPLIEHAAGIEEFDKVIEEAKENDPYQIIVNITARKSDPRRRSNDYVIKLQSAKKEKVNTPELIQQTISEQLAKFKEGLSGMPEETGLGILEERFEHQGMILQLNTEKKINDLEHSKEIEDLNRKLSKKEEEMFGMKTDFQELENDYDQLEEDFLEFKKNKFAGLSDQLSQVGTNALAGLAAKFMPLLTGGAGIAGLPGNAKAPENKSTTVINEDPNEVDALTEDIREMLNEFTQNEFSNFYNLMVLIAKDRDTLEIVMRFLKPDEKGEGSQ